MSAAAAEAPNPPVDGGELRARLAEDADRLGALGGVLESQEKLADALAAYAEAIRLQPDNAANWAALGNCHRKADDFVKMADDYSRAIRLKPWRRSSAVRVCVGIRGPSLVRSRRR